MIISRGFAALRLISSGLNKKICVTPVRHGGDAWVYRTGGVPPSKTIVYFSEALGGFMWWWILWHLWHEHEHLTGEFEYPDPSKWTDEELGIPPDDTEELGLKE